MSETPLVDQEVPECINCGDLERPAAHPTRGQENAARRTAAIARGLPVWPLLLMSMARRISSEVAPQNSPVWRAGISRWVERRLHCWAAFRDVLAWTG